jgi:hypothetical protein
MIANQTYDSMSVVQYQMSVLSLAAALDQSARTGAKEVSAEALAEAEHLRDLMERRTASGQISA